jgi:abequosyltransferase
LLPDRTDLSDCILNFAIRLWFPTTILAIRQENAQTMALEETDHVMRPIFGRNFRYWVFTYPALRLPLPLARVWVKAGITFSRVIDHARNPFFWRRIT